MKTDISALTGAALGTGFTFLMTVLGAGIIFLFKEKMLEKIQGICMGFAGGVMMAALVWSLLIPAMEQASDQKQIAWLVATLGFFSGGMLICGLDFLLSRPQYGNKTEKPNGERRRCCLFWQ